MMYPETPKRERVRQKKNLISDDTPDGIITNCAHEESIIDTDGFLVCRMCGIRIEKKKDRKEIFIDLFCTHKNTTIKDGFLVCVKCKGKIKKSGEK